MLKKYPIEGTIADELHKRLGERLNGLEEKVTSHVLERDDYIFTLGQIEALRWCKEAVKDLEDKLL